MNKDATYMPEMELLIPIRHSRRYYCTFGKSWPDIIGITLYPSAVFVLRDILANNIPDKITGCG
jgi:hypothetical protein